MRKKQIKVLIPLGALLLALVVLAGCRPSETLTQLMNAMNALNPSTEDMKTEDEENESEPDDKMDPIDETRDDAQIEATEELIGQMLENMDWETAQESLMAVYSASAGSSEWGAQQYNPDRLTYGSGNGNSPLVLNVKGDEVNSASKIAGTGEGSGTGTASVIETTDVQDEEGEETELPLTNPEDDTDLDNIEQQIGNVEDDDSEYEADSGGEGDNPEGGGNIDSGGGDPGDPDLNEGNEGTPDYSHEPWGNVGKRIAATGELANVVCMLGGADQLCATSSSFNSNVLAQEAFNSGGQMEYGTLWDGDGSYYLSNTDFEYLMEYWEPDVVFDFNHTSFSSDQEKRIVNEYNKKYVTVAAMTSQSNINSCMSTVASWIDSTNGTGTSSAANKVKQYQDWVNTEINALSDVQKYCGLAETVFIEEWDDYVKTTYAPEGGQKMTVATGAAVIKIGSSFRPLTEYLQKAEVYDWAAAPHTRGYNLDGEKYGTGREQGHLSVENYWCDLTGYTTTDTYGSAPGSLCYVTPVYDPVFASDFSSKSVSFENAQYSPIDNRIFKVDGTYSDNGELSFGNVFPGYSDSTSAWKAIIVKNKDIKAKLDSNAAWEYDGSYSTWSGNKRLLGSGSETYNGILHPLDGSTYYTTVAYKYDVVVNPKGLGDWVEGSPESILESIWAAWIIQDFHDERYVKQKIADFYNTFYGFSWNENSPEVTNILNCEYVN